MWSGSRWQDNAMLPRHAMRDSIVACILEPLKKSPKPIAIRITLCVDAGSSQLSDGSATPLGGVVRVRRKWWWGWEVWVARYGSALGMALAAAATPPRASSPETSRKLDCGLFPPQRPAASYAKSRTTSAASRCTSRASHCLPASTPCPSPDGISLRTPACLVDAQFTCPSDSSSRHNGRRPSRGRCATRQSGPRSAFTCQISVGIFRQVACLDP